MNRGYYTRLIEMYTHDALKDYPLRFRLSVASALEHRLTMVFF